ncbi:L-glutamate 3(R)-hydroxylase [Microdochium nivale]|nr:L-glutamate 3(R)-hydroxylase [Microdochium nivale]
MSSEATATLYKDVPKADLLTIDFARLFDKDPEEVAKLVHACERDGFFYIDLQNQSASNFWDDLFRVDEITREWFALPQEVKLRTPTVSLAHGFKAVGNQSGAIESRRDGFEALKIGKHELTGRWALAPVVREHLALFDHVTASCHFISKLLLDCLSDGLGLRGDARLETHHRDDCRSKSTLYMLHYPQQQQDRGTTSDPQQVGQNMHTDIGTLTILWAPQWGLQAFAPSRGAWEYVEPRTGRIVVNVGDTLRFLSGRRFKSALHRVLPVGEGGVQREDRYSISYFLRANDSAEFEDSNGDGSDAKSWYLQKYQMYEMPHEIQKQRTILSGGMAQELKATF